MGLLLQSEASPGKYGDVFCWSFYFMKIIKKLNNNCALAEDNNGRNLVAFGKGIGFPQTPYELTDMSKVDRTFYDVREENIPMFMEADERVILLSIELLDYIRAHVGKDISDYLYYVLVDHINFAIQRYRNGVYVPMDLSREIRYNYQREYDIASECRSFINMKMNVSLPKDETSIIAMHIVESEETSVKSDREIDINQTIEKVLTLVKEELQIEMDQDDFNVYRFETHVRYLLLRLQKGEFETGNEEMYRVVKEKYPQIDTLCEKVMVLINKEMNVKVTDSEKLYLMMHMSRLSEKEKN